jgi:thioredoxin-related protein
MRLMKYICTVLLLAGLSTEPAQAGTVPIASDLQEDASTSRAANLPILLIYTAKHCHYCDEVKAGVFNPIAADPAYRERMLLREVRIDSDIRLVGFNGDVTSHRSFATDRGITIVPTLEFLDGAGLQVSRPLVGVSIPDYYGAYVDNGIEQAIRNLRAQRSSS